MPDDGDRAQTINDNLQADALAKHFRNNPAPAHGGPRPSLNNKKAGRGVVTCIGCNEAINPRRLAAQPTATRCIDCQKDFERSQRR